MWKEIISDLKQAGWTQARIAQAVGVEQPTVSDLFNGRISQPRWDSGDKLKKLHRRVLKKKSA